MIRGTPFHTRTEPLCEARNWRRWSGYVVAASYELTHEREYFAVRNSAALFDVSPLFKYVLRGPDAARLLNRVVTRDVSACAPHQVLYTPWCDDDGKIIDDGTIQRLDEETFRLTAAHPNLHWLHENAIGLNVEITDETDDVAAVALQGPNARAILDSVFDGDVAGLRYFRLTTGHIGGVPATISRTGYTGDLGYEVWVAAGDAEALWDVLVKGGRPYGITPAGLLALDMVRIEAGLILIDVDYISAEQALIPDQKSSPYELGLGWTVNLNKEYFVGRDALEWEQRRGPAWRFVGLEIDWESLEAAYQEVGLPPQLPFTASRESVPVYRRGRQIGYVTSRCWSPLLKQYIALAHLEAAHVEVGTGVQMEITVQHRRKRAAARVAETPFFDPERKRA